MSYSVLPSILIPSWNCPTQYVTLNIKKQQNGGTIERGSANQINLTLQSYTLKCQLFTIASYNTVEQFFRDRNGAPFLYNAIVFKCNEWRWIVDESIWNFEATFEQVFKLQ